jgi:RHS repeat-associated protein
MFYSHKTEERHRRNGNYGSMLDVTNRYDLAGRLVEVADDTGTPYFPCYDANGNITAYIDTNGVVRAYRQYDAFGNTIAKGGAMVDILHFWYSTKYLDHDTGLYYYGYRYYSSLLQRWINRDPIEEEGGVNEYAFCGNNLNKYDVLGLAYGKFLTRKEAEQLACALKMWTTDASIVMPFVKGTTFYRPLALFFLKHFISKSGDDVILDYAILRDDWGVIQANRKAVRYFAGNPGAFKTVIPAQVAGEDLGQALQRMLITYERSGGHLLYAYLATEKYTFIDTAFRSKLNVNLPFLNYEPCCWKGGSEIHDHWLGDLERYGFAKAFRVRSSWYLIADW